MHPAAVVSVIQVRVVTVSLNDALTVLSVFQVSSNRVSVLPRMPVDVLLLRQLLRLLLRMQLGMMRTSHSATHLSLTLRIHIYSILNYTTSVIGVYGGSVLVLLADRRQRIMHR